MSTIWDEIRFKVIHSGSRLNLLIGINVGVFLVLGLIYVFEFLTTKQTGLHSLIVSYLVVPAYLPTLLTKFWTVITYMFMHDGLFPFAFNMLWFYWMGQIFEEYLGSKKLLTIYVLGGLFGAAFFILGFNLFPAFASAKVFATAVGAPACVMAVVVGTATLLPDYTIFMMFIGAVKLKWIAIVYVIIDILFLAGPNPSEAFAHLGGALLGFIYIKQLSRGNDWGGSIEKIFQPKSNLKIASKNTGRNVNSKPRQDEVDYILDKISKSGYDSLSKQEKETLFRASNDDKS
jgi:membrane associated rhomboid family serine protease